MEILSAIAVFLVEVFVPILFEAILGPFLDSILFFPTPASKRGQRYFKYLILFSMGALAGFLSTFVLKSLIMPDPISQALSLLIGPVVAGLGVRRLSEIVFRRKRDQIRFGGFWIYYWFTFAYLGMRLEIFYRT